MKLLYKVNPESDVYLAERSLEKITKSMIFHCFPDGLCVSGSSAGQETDSSLVRRVKAVLDLFLFSVIQGVRRKMWLKNLVNVMALV